MNNLKFQSEEEKRKHYIRNDFESYVRYVYRTIFKKPIKGFGKNQFGRALMDSYMRFYHKSALIHFINIPPRFGKTEMAMIYISWVLGRKPKAKFMYISYGETLASEPAKKLKMIMKSPQYKSIFPRTVISKTCDGTTYFKTTEGGSFYATGVGGALTGFGAGDGGGIIVDDILKTKDGSSEAMREEANEAFFQTIFSRRDSSDVPILLIGQRIDEHDIFGFLSENLTMRYEHLVLPAMIGGRSLCESTISTEQLLGMEESSPDAFWSQYMQKPMKDVDLLFETTEIARIDEIPDKSMITHSFITCDTSLVDKPTADFTVFGHFYVIASSDYKNHYIRDHKSRRGYFKENNKIIKVVLRDIFVSRMDAGNILKNFTAFLDERLQNAEKKPECIFIETKASGIQLYQEMIKLTEEGQKYFDEDFRIEDIGGQNTKKERRFVDVSGYVNHGRLQIVGDHLRNHLNVNSSYDAIIAHMKKINRIKNAKDDIADVITYGLANTYIGIYSSQAKKYLGNFETEALNMLATNLSANGRVEISY